METKEVSIQPRNDAKTGTGKGRSELLVCCDGEDKLGGAEERKIVVRRQTILL